MLQPPVLKPYGTYLQELVRHILRVPDRKERTQHCHALVKTLKGFHTLPDRGPEAHQKLWHALHILADWQLDVDAPYPAPDKEALHRPPQPLAYPVSKKRPSAYGHHVEALVQQVVRVQDPTLRQQLLLDLAKLMGQYHRRGVHAELLFRHIQPLAPQGFVIDQQRLLTKFLALQKHKNAHGPSRKASQ